ncbi:MAG: hypothetical protein OXQ92_06280 [Boseongicola sp.]|nr:hypothetical protein [Boseongicola sp.]MDD9979523.1 hypothetical protein [Boseongicola sp.]
MIRVLFLAAVLTISAAQSAIALSCLRPDAVRLFEYVRDADEPFYMVRGRIEITGPVSEPIQNSDKRAPTPARLVGIALGKDSFSSPFDRAVTIEAYCLGPWCGSAETEDVEMFFGVEIRDDELFVRIGPCGGDVVRWDRDGERRLLNCYRDGQCVSGQ